MGTGWGVGGIGESGAWQGVRGAFGAGKECRTEGPAGVGASVGHWWCRGFQGDVRGPSGVSGHQGLVEGIGGSRWTGSPTTLGPSPGSQHFHWFSLGSDLPHHGQARAPV